MTLLQFTGDQAAVKTVDFCGRMSDEEDQVGVCQSPKQSWNEGSIIHSREYSVKLFCGHLYFSLFISRENIGETLDM